MQATGSPHLPPHLVVAPGDILQPLEDLAVDARRRMRRAHAAEGRERLLAGGGVDWQGVYGGHVGRGNAGVNEQRIRWTGRC